MNLADAILCKPVTRKSRGTIVLGVNMVEPPDWKPVAPKLHSLSQLVPAKERLLRVIGDGRARTIDQIAAGGPIGRKGAQRLLCAMRDRGEAEYTVCGPFGLWSLTKIAG